MTNGKRPITSDRSVEKIGETVRDYLRARAGSGDAERSEPDAPVPLHRPADPAPQSSTNGVLGDDLATAARVQVLGLDLIRAQLGADWEKFGQKAKNHIERILSNRLSQVDVVESIGELRYAIVFASLPEDQARGKIALIASEIWRTLFGETEPPRGVTIDTAFVRIDKATPISAVDEAIEASQHTASSANKRSGHRRGNKTPTWQPLHKSRAVPHGGLPMWQATYRPVWDVTKAVVVAYRYTPTTTLDDGDALFDHEAVAGPLSHRDGGQDPAGIDRLFIQSVRDGLQHDGRNASRCLIICPVHYETFATPERQCIYLDLLNNLPRPFRTDLILELVGIPDGLPQVRLVQVVPMLKQHVRAVYCRTPLNSGLFQDLAEVGATAVGFDVTSLEISEKSVFELMPRFAAAAADAGLDSYALGIDRLSLATNAVCSGLSYLAGDAIMRAITRIENVYRFEPRDLVYPLARSHGKGC